MTRTFPKINRFHMKIINQIVKESGSLTEAAEKIGISLGLLHKIRTERSKCTVRQSTLDKICASQPIVAQFAEREIVRPKRKTSPFLRQMLNGHSPNQTQLDRIESNQHKIMEFFGIA